MKIVTEPYRNKVHIFFCWTDLFQEMSCLLSDWILRMFRKNTIFDLTVLELFKCGLCTHTYIHDQDLQAIDQCTSILKSHCKSRNLIPGQVSGGTTVRHVHMALSYWTNKILRISYVPSTILVAQSTISCCSMCSFGQQTIYCI